MGGVGAVCYYGQKVGILLKMVGIGFAKAYIYAWGRGLFFLTWQNYLRKVLDIWDFLWYD